MDLHKWTSIDSLAHVRRSLKKYKQAVPGFEIPSVVYKAKVKLHGTCASICYMNGELRAQSRTQFITPDNDNAGFAAWVFANEKAWKKVLSLNAGGDDTQVIVRGEWCGKGIQKGTALNQIDKKVFCIFAVELWTDEMNTFIYEPEELKFYVPSDGKYLRDDVHIIPWYNNGAEIEVHYMNTLDVEAAAEAVNESVLAVENCDPFVKETFGIEGLGEGLVYYALNIECDPMNSVQIETRYLFKAKGEKHRVVSSKTKATVEVLPGVEEFVTYAVTEGRLQQGLSEACNGEADPKLTGAFLKWVGGDVQKECQAELEDSGLEWKNVAKQVNARARKWFQGQL